MMPSSVLPRLAGKVRGSRLGRRFSSMENEGSTIIKTAWLCALAIIGWAGCATRVEERRITVEKCSGGVERVEVHQERFVWPSRAPTFRP
jgi:hypothetical protein